MGEEEEEEEEVQSGSARSVSLKLNRVGGGWWGRDGGQERVEQAKDRRGGGRGCGQLRKREDQRMLEKKKLFLNRPVSLERKCQGERGARRVELPVCQVQLESPLILAHSPRLRPLLCH